MADYRHIVQVCEQYLERHGDNYMGVGWTKSQADTDARYAVMLGVLDEPPESTVRVLDFGCGAAHLFEYVRRTGRTGLHYEGLDLSERFLELSRRKFPEVTFHAFDVLRTPDALPTFDYIILNGVLTARFELGWEAFWEYAGALLVAIFEHARRGIAFNVMSKQVEWERDDLFHLPMDQLATFITGHLSRHFVIRHDYGLYEYTCYVYRDPRRDH